MQINNQDMAIIEQALREAINQGADYHKVSTYQSVLGKLQEISHADAFAQATMQAQTDGFRYDYDDSTSRVQ
jgi:spore coat polysaccharide biosynthesis protein SpsF (cytidylyltransferase family)